ncbi:hypothetical protein LMH87_006619 [Akanthomyces muscarius]|uniref:DUF221 domain-containing protein n=1 Tax=Akanthomyces muscarius TaxID=2231603 RepID=A0A9W8QR82_AKAMU|nr:hypothetical protein LMH87_006619 [Akanthomyces muscarius]KAJ4164967.1 hypothetical protein LMH87_006619 [Akanthomyces muscarius]
MESAQPRLVSSSVAMMLLGSAWLLPSQAMADSDPAPLDIRSLIILAGRKTSDGASKAQSQSGIGIVTFITSITTALVIFAVQTSIFALLRNNLPRIFKPKTYLVPERERTEPPPNNFFAMIRTVVCFKDREIIKKCGLDAYFFLRYLKTLLIIFVPICAVVLPILIPLNYVGGIGKRLDVNADNSTADNNTVTGLDTLAWGNVRPTNTGRYAAHLVLAILVVIWICAVFFFELRAYVKVRQDYLTSAEHRLRASATTVLLNSIPKKWLSEEALRGLLDVFPGGVRNVWLNRDMSKLLDKVNLRKKMHRLLENAETELIKAAKTTQLKKQRKDEKRERKEMKLGALSKEEKAARSAKRDQEAKELANSGESEDAGDNDKIPHTVTAAVQESAMEIDEEHQHDHDKQQDTDHNMHNPLAGLTKTTSKVAGGLKNVASKSGKGIEDGLGTTHGFAPLSPKSKKSLSLSVQRPGTIGSHATHSPGGSIVSATSTSAIKKPEDVDDQGVGGNTVRKADDNDFKDNRRNRFWQFWKPPSGGYASPVPQGFEAEDYMSSGQKKDKTFWQTLKGFIPFMGGEGEEEADYPEAFDPEHQNTEEEDAEWRKYLKKKQRPTHHLPLFGVNWLFGISGITKKVDTIYYCRKELARLNLEIEEDQKHPDRYPLMNSAFVQFNHQVGAHMACQSAVHHIPRQMSSKIIEISPRDVVWDNMAISWWEEGLRAFIAIGIVLVMAFFWAIPVAATAAVSQLDQLIQENPWLHFLKANQNVENLAKIIAGVLPAALLALLLVLVPPILNLLAGIRGAKTGTQKTEFVQFFYFIFLFLQVFLVVSIASFFAASLDKFVENIKDQLGSVESVLNLLADNLPKAANYFFGYMILQALSTSSGTLLQIVSLLFWFIIGPMFDSTARNKWARNTNLNNVQWGAFFPVYTNFACIAIFYSIISPLISIFAIVTFGLLWLAQRYAMVYVYRMEHDTGGVLYPRAINQTFTGLYFMEACMAGLFFIARDQNKQASCIPHGVIMLVVMFLTAVYQYLLHQSFSPLFRYLPITFEDEAVLRDEAFQRAQDARLGVDDDDDDDDDEEDIKEPHGMREKSPSLMEGEEGIELNTMQQENRRPTGLRPNPMKQVGTWAVQGGRQMGGWAKGGGNQLLRLTKADRNSQAAQYRRAQRKKDLEAQRAMGNALFGGVHDEIEDLTPDERDMLTRHAFLHSALRARRPAVWIPRDDLGISEDEIKRTRAFSKHIWISNEGTALDSKVRVIYGRHPPDFSEVDVINL